MRRGRDGLVERIAGWVVESKHAMRDSVQGCSVMVWADCLPRRRGEEALLET